MCDAKRNWDDKLPNELMQNWVQWEERLPEQLTVPRSLAVHQEEVQSIELHAFGDASRKGVAAAVYALVVQESGVKQGLVAARARLTKKDLTIPRLELVSGHMAAYLLTNVTEELDGFSLTTKYCSSNRVQKIQSHSEVMWRHVGTTANPADIGSRSGEVSNHPLWWNGPQWLQHKARWPPDIVPNACQETLAEAKATRDVFAVAIAETDELDTLFEKFSYWKVMGICAWIMRFIGYNLVLRCTNLC